MPNQITHYYLADEVRKELTGRAKEAIDKYPKVFNLGSLGPDFLFVLREAGIGNAPQYANVMQYLHMYEVFDNAAEYIGKLEDKDCALSYILGLICHYVMDMRSHPYVYFFVEEVMPKAFPQKYISALHAILESAIDETILIEYMKTDPRKFDISKYFRLSSVEKNCVADLYFNSINSVIGFNVKRRHIKLAIKITNLYFKLTISRRGIKKRIVSYLEDRKEKKKQLSSSIRPPLLMGEYDFMNRSKISWRKVRNKDEYTTESFDEIIQDVRILSQKYIKAYMDRLFSGKTLKRKDFSVNYEGTQVY